MATPNLLTPHILSSERRKVSPDCVPPYCFLTVVVIDIEFNVKQIYILTWL